MTVLKMILLTLLSCVVLILTAIILLKMVFLRWPHLRTKWIRSLLSCPDMATFLARRKTIKGNIENQLETADAPTRKVLKNQLSEIDYAIEHAEAELPKIREIVWNLIALLSKHGKALDKTRVNNAIDALKMEKYNFADVLLSEIAAKPGMRKELAANIAFARGNIARMELRWQDGVEHYKHSMDLVPNVMALRWIGHFQEELGQYNQAVLVRQDILKQATDELGAAHQVSVVALTELAISYEGSGDVKAAVSCLNKALPLIARGKGLENDDYLIHLKMLAMLHQDRGDYAAGEQICREVLEIEGRMIGKLHPDYITSLSRLAVVLDDQGDYSTAEPLYREVLKLTERDHPKYAMRLSNLARMLKDKGDYEAAEPLYRQALENVARTVGKEHQKYAVSLNSLALLLVKKGDYAKAEPLYREALAVDVNAIGKNSIRYAVHLGNLAHLLALVGDAEGAEVMYQDTMGIFAKTTDGHQYCYAVHLGHYAKLLQSKGDYTAAEEKLRIVVSMRENKLGKDHSDSIAARKALDDILKVGRPAGYPG